MLGSLLTQGLSSKADHGNEATDSKETDEENGQTPKEHRPVRLACLSDGNVPHVPLHNSGSDDE